VKEAAGERGLQAAGEGEEGGRGGLGRSTKTKMNTNTPGSCLVG
jgi:hypothetical protein